jgi:hypothetical protein
LADSLKLREQLDAALRAMVPDTRGTGAAERLRESADKFLCRLPAAFERASGRSGFLRERHICEAVALAAPVRERLEDALDQAALDGREGRGHLYLEIDYLEIQAALVNRCLVDARLSNVCEPRDIGRLAPGRDGVVAVADDLLARALGIPRRRLEPAGGGRRPRGRQRHRRSSG